jgi:hypothetical protein
MTKEELDQILLEEVRAAFPEKSDADVAIAMLVSKTDEHKAYESLIESVVSQDLPSHLVRLKARIIYTQMAYLEALLKHGFESIK